MIEGLRKPVGFHQKSKVVVIGSGNVGEAVAYTLMVRMQANDIVLIDINEPRAAAAALDRPCPLSSWHQPHGASPRRGNPRSRRCSRSQRLPR